MARRMVPVPRIVRYSGSDRPAWRMNHTGIRSVASPRQARRNGESWWGPGIAAKSTTRTLGIPMRRSIDDDQIPVPPLEDDADDMTPVNWAVSICDDYDDAGLRVQLTVEEVGAAGTGLVAHLDPAAARRLRLALRSALGELAEDPGR